MSCWASLYGYCLSVQYSLFKPAFPFSFARCNNPCVLQVFIKIMSANLRPPVANLTGSVPEWIRALLPLCWARLQEDRPTAAAICEVLWPESFVLNIQLSYKSDCFLCQQLFLKFWFLLLPEFYEWCYPNHVGHCWFCLPPCFYLGYPFTALHCSQMETGLTFILSLWYFLGAMNLVDSLIMICCYASVISHCIYFDCDAILKVNFFLAPLSPHQALN